ncbi:Adenosine kinase [Intoshia linei]|uniref:adenosine kinase n=1 Tax=Intoshia linei TaxID=1819745 RepID=A0A177BCL2_9BILA|nr:Adenosine kinase [Intoshia linei]
MKNKIFAFGNALVDKSAIVDTTFLQKYNLEKNGIILIDEKAKNLILEFSRNYKCDVVPGGSSLNVFRMMQWIINEENVIFYASCIGDDEMGRQLNIQCSKSNLITNFEISKEHQTGICCVMISKDRRYRQITGNGSRCHSTHIRRFYGFTHQYESFTRFAHILHYGESVLDSVFPTLPLVFNILYIVILATSVKPGYIFMLRPKCILKLAKEYYESNKRVIYNISAEFICHVASKHIIKLMKYVHIVIGNDQEFESLAKLYDISVKDEILLKTLGKKLINEYFNHSLKLIMTCGSDPVIYAEVDECESIKCEKINIIKIDNADINDTNGAGDAFAGGFLSVYIKNENDYKKAILRGNKAANYIIQQSGFNIEHDINPPFLFKDFIDTYEYDIVPGGSSLNVLRMLQWIINEKNCIAYASCIGNDEEGRQLRIECSKSHLKTNFEISHKNSTGICCAMISKDRKYRKVLSLATNLGATQDISEEFMLSPENLNYLKNTNVFYITVITNCSYGVISHSICSHWENKANKSIQYMNSSYGIH